MDKVGNAVMKVARNQGDIVPRDFAAAVKDIKLAILQSRARAAHASNVEALKLYFYVGGYVSKKTRTAKWGSGAIDVLSNRLQVELPGLRGGSASNINRQLTNWPLASGEMSFLSIRPLPMVGNPTIPCPGHRRCPPRIRQRAQRTHQEESFTL